MVVLADSARSLYHDILQALVARVEGKQPLWLFVMLSPVCVLQVLVSKDSCLSGEGEAQVMWCWQYKEDDQWVWKPSSGFWGLCTGFKGGGRRRLYQRFIKLLPGRPGGFIEWLDMQFHAVCRCLLRERDFLPTPKIQLFVDCICSGKVNVKMLSKCQVCLEQESCQRQVALEVEGVSFRSDEVLSLLGANVNWTKRNAKARRDMLFTPERQRDTERERARTGYSYCKMTSEGCEELFRVDIFLLKSYWGSPVCMVRWWFASRWERVWVRAVIWKVFREGNASILCFVNRRAGSQGHGSE